MYYVAKLAQAAGLTVILAGFMQSFPALMNRQVLLIGCILFGLGWAIQQFILKS